MSAKKQTKPRQKREESPETKRIRQDKARARYYSKRGRDEPVRTGRAGAAWQGLENNTKGDATYAYKSIMKDAKQHGYHVTKEEAARTAKKHPESSEAVQRARAHHGVSVSRRKKQKTE